MTALWNTPEAIDARIDRARIMQSLREQQVTQREIAKAIGISRSRVGQIFRRIDMSIKLGVWPDRLVSGAEYFRSRK